MSKFRAKEEAFLKSRFFGINENSQPQHHTISYPNTAKWGDNTYPANYNEAMMSALNQWHVFINSIVNLNQNDTCTLILDCRFTDIQKLKVLSTVIKMNQIIVTEVAVHNIGDAMPYSSSYDLIIDNKNAQSSSSQSTTTSTLSKSTLFQSSLIGDALTKSILPSLIDEQSQMVTPQSICKVLIENEQKSLKKSLTVIFSKATKINLTNLPLWKEPSSNFIFEILEGVKCSELSLLSDSPDILIVEGKLHGLMTSTKYIKTLDISGMPPKFLKDASDMIVTGCFDNPRLTVRYGAADYSTCDDYKTLYDFSKIRIEAHKEDYIKSLLQVAHTITSTGIEIIDVHTKPGEKLIHIHYIPQDIVNVIMQNYVEPFNYMRESPSFQPDGQHIFANPFEEASLAGAVVEDFSGN